MKVLEESKDTSPDGENSPASSEPFSSRGYDTTISGIRNLLEAIDASGHDKIQTEFRRARLVDPGQVFFDEFSMPPQVLYKYVSAARLDHVLPDLKLCSFRATPPSELNETAKLRALDVAATPLRDGFVMAWIANAMRLASRDKTATAPVVRHAATSASPIIVNASPRPAKFDSIWLMGGWQRSVPRKRRRRYEHKHHRP